MAVLIVPNAPSGLTTRFRVMRLSDGYLFNALTGAFEAYNAANWTATKYMVAMAEQGSSGTYSGTFPAVPVPARVAVVAHQDAVPGTPSPTDPAVWHDAYRWDGTTLYALDSPGTDGSGNVTLGDEAITDSTIAPGALAGQAVAAVVGGVGGTVGGLAAQAKADVAAAVLSDPTRKLLTDSSGRVTTANPATVRNVTITEP
jgi:hypothetical protein